MLLLLLLFFIVFPVLLIYFASSGGSSSKKDSSFAPSSDFPDEQNFSSRNSKDEIHLPAQKDSYGNYSDAVYDYALDLGPEDLREEDPDLYDEIYGWKANNPDNSGY